MTPCSSYMVLVLSPLFGLSTGKPCTIELCNRGDLELHIAAPIGLLVLNPLFGLSTSKPCTIELCNRGDLELHIAAPI